MKNTSKAEVLGYEVYASPLSEIKLDKALVINTLNGHSYNVAKADPAFRKALQASDILLPDGVSVVFGARVLSGQKIQKIAGYDIFIHLLKKVNEQKGSCFFLGASLNTLHLIGERLDKDFPNVRFGSFSPPYRAQFSEAENKMMCENVNEFQPDVLFIGMTAPKQEKWVHENKERLQAGVICSIGAVFDFYAGTTERPANWVINLKLEWLGRLLKEPKRMWRRYLLSTPVFFIDVLKEKVTGSKKSKSLKV
jgi:N-acetylglucosaminyldiphosphoundecaprenol N-acetyl-beta-D-mannosaminyltransferase